MTTAHRAFPVALILASTLAAPAAPAVARTPVLPQQEAGAGSPAARCAREFVAMVNDPTPANVRAFESTWASSKRLGVASIDERVPRVAGLRDQWGKLTVTALSETPDKSAVISASTASGRWLQLSLNMSVSEAGKLDSIEIEESNQPIENRPLDAAVRAEAVQGVADVLRGNYVYPEKGAKMADAIVGKLKAGDYDAITTESALARRLTEDCRAITKDGHLGIRAVPKREGPGPQGAATAAPGPMARDNHAFKKVEVLDGNIGYLRFDGFMSDADARRVATHAMNFLSGCDALIIDMRYNGGGNPEMVQYVTSYLFESKTHLNDMVDRHGNIVEEFWTLTDVPGPRPRSDVPVYVLTSSRTFSGAEEFCYNLKNLKRATIVGETTGGGAHPVRAERVSDRFVVHVPYMRARNPISETNWEGTGVEPDVKTTAAGALDKAVELARTAVNAPR